MRIFDTFDPFDSMNAIDGCIADLASKTNRPRGYPFSKITIFSIEPLIARFMPHFCHKNASSLHSMRRLDFKKAGKVFGKQVQQMKDNLDSVPDEYIIIAERFDIIDESTRKTTACRKYLIEVETEDCEERWQAICFKKAVKKYVTENLDLHITPCIFGDKYPQPNPKVIIPRVWCHFVDGPESLYQSLEIYGKKEFADTPIRLGLRTREEIYHNIMPEGIGKIIGDATLVFDWMGR